MLLNIFMPSFHLHFTLCGRCLACAVTSPSPRLCPRWRTRSRTRRWTPLSTSSRLTSRWQPAAASGRLFLSVSLSLCLSLSLSLFLSLSVALCLCLCLSLSLFVIISFFLRGRCSGLEQDPFYLVTVHGSWWDERNFLQLHAILQAALEH